MNVRADATEQEKLMILHAELMSHSFRLLVHLSPYSCHQQETGSNNKVITLTTCCQLNSANMILSK